MADFSDAARHVLKVEGGLSLDENDPGNWTGGAKGRGVLKGTKYGISARQYPEVDIVALTLGEALAIYRRDYWETVHADEIPWPLNLLVFDMAVNQAGGPEFNGMPQPAIALMQRALGIADDGIFGPVTRRHAAESRPFHWAKFMALRAERYTKTRNFDLYGHGWFIRLFTIALEV